MPTRKRLYRQQDWIYFSQQVQQRDGYKCLRCNRGYPVVTLQVHHQKYIPGKQPWEYPLSDCLTLCKGCHAQEHNLIEPSQGWTLLSLDDLGGLLGVCERLGCGSEIRYEHTIYHPEWGYKRVGSTCVEYLTQEDRFLSSNLIKIYKNISDFVHDSIWQTSTTKNGKKYIHSKYKHHEIRIYGYPGKYAMQLGFKFNGRRCYDYEPVIQLGNRSLEEVKELAYIRLKVLISKKIEEREVMNILYCNLGQNQ